MTRIEMIDKLLDSYTIKELRTLAHRLGIDLLDNNVSRKRILLLSDKISDILFDPAGSYHEFNKLAEENNNVS